MIISGRTQLANAKSTPAKAIQCSRGFAGERERERESRNRQKEERHFGSRRQNNHYVRIHQAEQRNGDIGCASTEKAIRQIPHVPQNAHVHKQVEEEISLQRAEQFELQNEEIDESGSPNV